MEGAEINCIYYSLTDKAEYSKTAVDEMLKQNNWSLEDAVKQLSLVVCTKLIVYGTLRYKDAAYNRFKHCFVNPVPTPVLLENYHKIRYFSSIFAVEPYKGAVLEAEMFYVYPDCLEELDAYEGVNTHLYERVWTEQGYIYLKGKNSFIQTEEATNG